MAFHICCNFPFGTCSSVTYFFSVKVFLLHDKAKKLELVRERNDRHSRACAPSVLTIVIFIQFLFVTNHPQTIGTVAHPARASLMHVQFASFQNSNNSTERH